MTTDVPQAADRDQALAYLRRADPVLAPLIAAHPDFDPRAWRRELPPFDAFGALLFQVIGQQLSVAATRGILRRVQDLFGGKLPTPAEILAAAPEDLHRTGLSRRKVATLRAVAEEFVACRLSDEQLRHLSDEEIEARLTAIPGIGPWTVQGFLIIALDRQDVVLPGDLALRKSIRRLYGMDHLPSQQEVLQLSEPWRPYRSLATSYLFQAAFDAVTEPARSGSSRSRSTSSTRRYGSKSLDIVV
jgi:DNA-3-methyladenine glycosylase II